MTDQIRRLYDVELEPEVRDWLESLSDSDFRRVDEVCGLLADRRAVNSAAHGVLLMEGSCY